VLEAAQDDAREGSRWLEIQVDPTSYAVHLGGLTPTLEIVLDAARDARARFGLGVGVVVAASRIRHPLDARTLARLAARYAGEGVVGFGLSNDERRGDTAEFAPAFRIARNAGLASVPHGGELLGAHNVRLALDHLAPDRIGHGVRSVEDPSVLADVVRNPNRWAIEPKATGNVVHSMVSTKMSQTWFVSHTGAMEWWACSRMRSARGPEPARTCQMAAPKSAPPRTT